MRTYNGVNIRGVLKNSGIDQPCAECGTIAQRYYDANGNIERTVNFKGGTTTYTHDPVRNLETSRTDGSGKTTTAWHPVFRLPAKVAQPQRLTTYTYDDKGDLLERREVSTTDMTGAAGLAAVPVGEPRVWTYTYNAQGQPLTIDGPRTDVNDVTTYAYDAEGNLASVTDALGHVTTLSNYDAHGRVGRVVEPNGRVTELAYTPRGWLASRLVSGDGQSALTSYEYDGAGNMTKVIQPDGSTMSFTYDLAHRLTAIEDSAGNRITYRLDLRGNRLSEKVHDPDGTLTRNVTRTFDAIGRMQTQTGGGL